MMKLVSEQRVSDDSLLDWEGLRSRCLGRVDLMERVLGRFHESLEQDLQTLEDAAEELDSERIARWAHRLKGAAMTVSATGIQNRAERLERLLSRGSEQQVRECLVDLKDQCTNLSDMIQGHLSGDE